MDKTVGIVGLGIMGSAIARNLVDRGWRVIGFDIDAARRAELALANVMIADNVGQVARDAPIIMTSLPGPAAVEDVHAGRIDLPLGMPTAERGGDHQVLEHRHAAERLRNLERAGDAHAAAPLRRIFGDVAAVKQHPAGV